MKNSLVIAGCLLLTLAACSSGNDSKQAKDANQANQTNQPKKSVFDPYMKDVNKAKQVQGKLDAAQQKANAQLQQAQSASTNSQAQAAQPPSDN